MKHWLAKYFNRAAQKSRPQSDARAAAPKPEERPRLAQSIWAHPGQPLGEGYGLGCGLGYGQGSGHGADVDPAREHMENVIVYRAVSLISHNLASVPWILKKGDTPITDHPLAHLMQSPNPRQSRAAFVESLAAHILLYGNGYLEAVGQREMMDHKRVDLKRELGKMEDRKGADRKMEDRKMEDRKREDRKMEDRRVAPSEEGRSDKHGNCLAQGARDHEHVDRDMEGQRMAPPLMKRGERMNAYGQKGSERAHGEGGVEGAYGKEDREMMSDTKGVHRAQGTEPLREKYCAGHTEAMAGKEDAYGAGIVDILTHSRDPHIGDSLPGSPQPLSDPRDYWSDPATSLPASTLCDPTSLLTSPISPLSDSASAFPASDFKEQIFSSHLSSSSDSHIAPASFPASTLPDPASLHLVHDPLPHTTESGSFCSMSKNYSYSDKSTQPPTTEKEAIGLHKETLDRWGKRDADDAYLLKEKRASQSVDFDARRTDALTESSGRTSVRKKSAAFAAKPPCKSDKRHGSKDIYTKGKAGNFGACTEESEDIPPFLPQELYILRPDRMRVQPGRNVFPAAYEYTVEGHKRRIPVDPQTGQSAVLHIKNFHPQQDWYGLSPLQAAALSIRQHRAISCHNLALMENGGRPSGALMIKPDTQSAPLDDAARQDLKSQLMESYAGADNAGRMMVLEGDMDWKSMSLTPNDMDFGAAKNMAAREIAQAYGVPPMLVGVPGDATFANYREARFHLWEDTILPLLNVILSEVNRWFFPPNSAYRFTYDVDQISAMALRRDPIWQRLKDADFLTEDEKRAAVGFGPKTASES